MKISYSVSSMVFWWRETTVSLELECQFLKSQGFGIELWPYLKGRNDCRYNRRNWPRLIEATRGMRVSMRSRDDDPNILEWAEQIECAKQLNANIITDLRNLCISNDPGMINGTAFAADVIKLAQDNNVTLSLETGNLATVKAVGEKYDSLCYCLDIGYANLDPKFSFKQYIDELAPRINHLHLSDNYGRTDDHLTPGLQGGMARENWDHLLNILTKYDNEIIGCLEMTPPTPSTMLRQGCEFLFDQLKWPNKPPKQPGPAQ